MYCKPAIFSWADPSADWIAQNLRHPWLDIIVPAISRFGEMPAIVIAIALSYWFWDKKIAKLLAYATLTSFFINIWIKGIVMECRPPNNFWLENISAHSYSFPSGHAQVTITLLAGIAYFSRSKLFSSLCVGLGLLVAFSRPYMGVHYLHDTFAGLCIGSAILLAFVFIDKKMDKVACLKKTPAWIQIFLLTILLFGVNYLINKPNNSMQISINASILLFGLFLGSKIEGGKLNLVNEHPRMFQIIIFIFIGLSGIFILKNGVSMLHSYLSPVWMLSLKYVQYMLIGLWISYFAPKLFKLFNFGRH